MEPTPAEQPDEAQRRFIQQTRGQQKRHLRRIIVGTVATVVALFLVCGGVVGYGVYRARLDMRNAQFKKQMRMVGFGATSFHQSHDHFPPPGPESPETPLPGRPMSFQAALLPYVGYFNLYRSIKATGDGVFWDDPRNQWSRRTVPIYFSPHSDIKKTDSGFGATFIVPNSRMMPEAAGLRRSDVEDGTSNTILAGEIDETDVPAWADPANGRDPAGGFAGGAKAFGSVAGGEPFVVMADGSVRRISADIDPEVAKALATPAGGEQIPQ